MDYQVSGEYKGYLIQLFLPVEQFHCFGDHFAHVIIKLFIDLIKRITGLMIIGVIFHTKIQERYFLEVKCIVIRLIGPVLLGALTAVIMPKSDLYSR
jgi:hypothetical protein